MKILFDIGATNMRVARAEGKKVEGIKKVPTPHHPKEGLEMLVSLVRECAAGGIIDSLVGGIPGLPTKTGDVLFTPNLPKWKEFPLGRELTKNLGVPARVEHDANLGALGEATYGAGKGATIVVFVAIGTGVGTARIVGGKIDEALFGFEAGHQILDMSKKVALDEMVSGLSVAKRFGMHPSEVLRSEYDALTPTLAVGLYNMILHWSPDVLVLGGSMMNEENGFRLADVVKALERLPVLFPLPDVRVGALRDAAGLYGALTL